MNNCRTIARAHIIKQKYRYLEYKLYKSLEVKNKPKPTLYSKLDINAKIISLNF